MTNKLQKKWCLKPQADPIQVKRMKSIIGEKYSPLAEVLVQRNLNTIEDIKNWIPGISIGSVDPMKMADMSIAIKRLQLARKNKETIFIFGDYDVDGTTAVSTMSIALKKGGWKVITYIPDRYKEGYGLSKKGIDSAIDSGASLLITLDCGIKAIDLVNYAKEKNLDVIITDHHRPGEVLPDAIAVINPKRSDCQFPHKELSGCGVGYLLCRAVYQVELLDIDELDSLMDLVAISIGADMVPITGLNRFIVREGLQMMNNDPRPSISALLGKKKEGLISLEDVVFAIGPKINAAGRMSHGQFAVDLLTTPNPQLLEKLGNEIENYNLERRSTEEIISSAAKELALTYEKDIALVLYGSNWHKGVLGIVAQRMVELFHKPTIVLTEGRDGVISGSARSVPGLNIYDAIESSSKYILQFGGHHAAAGLTLTPNNLYAFRKEFNISVNTHWQKEKRSPEILIDTAAKPEDLNEDLCLLLDKLAPFGIGNKSPVWGLYKVTMEKTSYMSSNKHLRTLLTNPISRKQIPAIGFGWGSFRPKNKEVNVAVVLEWNYFRGEKRLQARIIDIQNVM